MPLLWWMPHWGTAGDALSNYNSCHRHASLNISGHASMKPTRAETRLFHCDTPSSKDGSRDDVSARSGGRSQKRERRRIVRVFNAIRSTQISMRRISFLRPRQQKDVFLWTWPRKWAAHAHRSDGDAIVHELSATITETARSRLKKG